MKKILVVGDSNSIFIKQYIENVLVKNGYQVVLIKEGFISEERKQEYKDLGVILEDRNVGLVSKIPLVRTLLGAKAWCKKIAEKYGEFSVVHVHGVNKFRGSVGKIMREHCKKLVVSVWGDEVLRGDEKRRKAYAKFYEKADVITTATSHLYSNFIKAYGDRFKDKIMTCRFGLSVFDKMDEMEKKFTRDELFNYFGLKDSSKITVLVGYNGRDCQNLIPLTKTLQTLPNELLNKIIAVYTLTYGKRSEEYDRELKEEISKLNCEKLILTNYMNEDKSAKLRLISDVLLHAQPTDAFSASVQECLYRGAIVFNGAWLVYNELAEIGAKIVAFNDYKELANILPVYLGDYQNKRKEFANNKEALRGLSSQEATEKAWLKAIEI